ncbi:GNAT family acetyltransferase [Purpureocillium lilacinum]|nr:GNAT family acetyltransferase [Purpureocillium lilacinum]
MPVLHRSSKPIERIDARISAPKRRNSDIYGRSTHGSLDAKMPAIRKARRSDIRAMAESAAAAFMDEELWGKVMHPHRKEYPGDFVLGFERKILRNWHHPRRRFLVGLDRHSGKVVGFAEWERQGILDDPVAPSWVQYLDIGQAMNKATEYFVEGVSYLRPNRAADPTKTHILDETFPLIAHYWCGHRSQNWCLQLLAVHPDFQGHGLGAELVQWGVDAADEESICASVVSAEEKEGFYNRFGFAEVGKANVGSLKDNGINGGAIMFRERRCPETNAQDKRGEV